MKSLFAHGWLQRGLRLAALTLAVATLTAGCDDPGKGGTIVVPTEVVPYLLVEPDQVTIPASAQGAIAPMHRGDILVIAGDPNAAAPMVAALRRVEELTHGPDGRLIVRTTPAALGDVIQDAKLTSTFQVAPPKSSGDARTLGRSLGGLEVGTGRRPLTLPDDTARVEVTQAHLRARPDLDVDLAIEDGAIQRIGAMLSGQLDASLTVNVAIDAGVTRNLDVPLIKEKTYFVQMAGWVPVVWAAEITLGVGIEIHAVTESRFELGGVVSTQLRGGATWTPEGWTSVGDAQFDVTPTGAGLTNRGTYDVRAYAFVKVDVQLYDAVGPYFTVRPFIAERREPDRPLVRTAGVQGVFGAEIAVPVFDFTLAAYEVTLFNPNIDLPTAAPSGCGDLDYRGECQDGVVRWCNGGQLHEVDCATSRRGCGWVDDTVGNFCTAGCGDLGFAGACVGDDVRWCENGIVSHVTCVDSCGWDGNSNWYACQ